LPSPIVLEGVKVETAQAETVVGETEDLVGTFNATDQCPAFSAYTVQHGEKPDAVDPISAYRSREDSPLLYDMLGRSLLQPHQGSVYIKGNRKNIR
ncbi:hypothetical protein MR532_02075, partial [bacterium]|nr:hypothetical protein [bacterium]